MSRSAALHHAFVLTDAGAPVAETLVEAGFVEGSGRQHVGQGTANRRFFFHNFMLELLWIEDENEASRGDSARLAFPQRHRACPIGLLSWGKERLFEAAWSYRLKGLPPGAQLEVSVDSQNAESPLCVHLPFVDSARPPDGEPCHHPNGAGRLLAAGLEGPRKPSHSPSPIQWRQSARWLLTLRFSSSVGAGDVDLQDSLPLRLVWSRDTAQEASVSKGSSLGATRSQSNRR